MFKQVALLTLLALGAVKADYDPAHLPAKTDSAHGQSGYNDCVSRYGASSSTAKCQNIFLNSIKDFCLFAPPTTDVRFDFGSVRDRSVPSLPSP